MSKSKSSSNATKHSRKLINIKARLYIVALTLCSSKVSIALFSIVVAVLLCANSGFIEINVPAYIELWLFLLACVWVCSACLFYSSSAYWQDKVVNYRCDPEELQIYLRRTLEYSSKKAAFRQKVSVQLFGACVSSGSLEAAASLMEQIAVEKERLSDGWRLLYAEYCCDYWSLVGDVCKFTSAYDDLVSKLSTGNRSLEMRIVRKQLDLEGLLGKKLELNDDYQAALVAYGLSSGIPEDPHFHSRSQEVMANARLARCWEQMGHDALPQWAFVARYGGTLYAAKIARNHLSQADPFRVSQISVPTPTAPGANRSRRAQLIVLLILWLIVYWGGFFLLT